MFQKLTESILTPSLHDMEGWWISPLHGRLKILYESWSHSLCVKYIVTESALRKMCEKGWKNYEEIMQKGWKRWGKSVEKVLRNLETEWKKYEKVWKQFKKSVEKSVQCTVYNIQWSGAPHVFKVTPSVPQFGEWNLLPGITYPEESSQLGF